jgi:hypothetical protein
MPISILRLTFAWPAGVGMRCPQVPVTVRCSLNDAGQFLSGAAVATPIMHISLVSSENSSNSGQSVTFTANESAIVGFPPQW